MEQGYKKLEIYQVAHALAVRVHKMTLCLPRFERYEEGSQIRRSAEETIEHLELLFEAESLKDENLFKDLVASYDSLCRKILRYIQAVDRTFERPEFMKEPEVEYLARPDKDLPDP